MRRIISVLALAAGMAAMIAVVALPAFADGKNSRTIPNARYFGGRLMLVLAALAALLMALATPAQAQTVNQKIPISGSFFNICRGGETFTLEGTLHLVGKSSEDESGGTHNVVHSNLQLQGESPSGAKYVFNETTNSPLKADIESADTITLTNHGNLIRQGEDGTVEEVRSRTVIHITRNPNGELTAVVNTFEFECQ
jgi:hypothetical protein